MPKEKSNLLVNRLYVFALVVKFESQRKAADYLGIKEASMSQNITTLEEELGEKLFKRCGRHKVLSEYGEALYARIGPGLEEVRQYLDG